MAAQAGAGALDADHDGVVQSGSGRAAATTVSPNTSPHSGAGLAELMRQTRHRSTGVALGYLRPADLWRSNATGQLFRPPCRGGDGD
jgi:hypothetical protein